MSDYRALSFEDKIVARDKLAARVAALPQPIVLTNGVFDILHRGHVTYLSRARALGACLVVAVNADVSVRALGKGPERPINGEDDRAAILASLECVDLVTIFSETVPLPVLEIVRPQVYVKGGDYDVQRLEESKWVRSWGGEARALQFVPGYSTTALVGRIRS